MSFLQIFCGGIAVAAGMFVLVPVILPPDAKGIGTTQVLELAGVGLGLFVIGWLFGKAIHIARTIQVRRRRSFPSLNSLMF